MSGDARGDCLGGALTRVFVAGARRVVWREGVAGKVQRQELETTRSGRTSRPPNRHVPSHGKLFSEECHESAARQASGAAAAAKRQRAAERALSFPTAVRRCSRCRRHSRQPLAAHHLLDHPHSRRHAHRRRQRRQLHRPPLPAQLQPLAARWRPMCGPLARLALAFLTLSALSYTGCSASAATAAAAATAHTQK